MSQNASSRKRFINTATFPVAPTTVIFGILAAAPGRRCPPGDYRHRLFGHRQAGDFFDTPLVLDVGDLVS
jgi:hypothetical protein